jgi:hypothetical protein
LGFFLDDRRHQRASFAGGAATFYRIRGPDQQFAYLSVVDMQLRPAPGNVWAKTDVRHRMSDDLPKGLTTINALAAVAEINEQTLSRRLQARTWFALSPRPGRIGATHGRDHAGYPPRTKTQSHLSPETCCVLTPRIAPPTLARSGKPRTDLVFDTRPRSD